jgi:hypothetical protein
MEFILVYLDRSLAGSSRRIRYSCQQDPILLLAYTYHMYMALLFGGQMIRKMVKRSFSLQEEVGLQTFGFGGKSKMVRYISRRFVAVPTGRVYIVSVLTCLLPLCT